MVSATATNFKDWRESARVLLRAGISPVEVTWTEGFQQPLFESLTAPDAQPPTVPRKFLELAETVASHRDANRWGLLYDVLYRIVHGERNLLEIEVDPSVRALLLMQKEVQRDIHQMHAFVRFRKIAADDGERFVAWYRPDHYILERAAPFFVERFAAMRWAILTPHASALWDGREISFGPGVPRSEAPPEDQLDDLWRTYYKSVFNPARLNLEAMRTEMPVRRWAALPESRAIGELVQDAQSRVDRMIANAPTSAAPFVPRTRDLSVLREAARICEGCDLFRCATQAVFGEGPATARLVLVGEQPGDQEDRAGRPFIGPAGEVLNRALREAGVPRDDLYVTNAVKHFKFEERGKRRIHQTPSGAEVSACRPWVETELEVIRPRLIVCLGATAALSIFGRVVRVTRERGRFFPHPLGGEVTPTIHPSAILRIPEPDRADAEYGLLVRDLRTAWERIAL